MSDDVRPRPDRGPLALLLRSPIDTSDAPAATRLARADRMIDLGWVVAVLWGVMRLVGALVVADGTGEFQPAWLVDPLLIGLLAYGLYRRSRACAVLLLAYVVVELWLAYHAAGRPSGVGVALALELAFLTGLRGTLLWHRETADAARRA